MPDDVGPEVNARGRDQSIAHVALAGHHAHQSVEEEYFRKNEGRDVRRGRRAEKQHGRRQMPCRKGQRGDDICDLCAGEERIRFVPVTSWVYNNVCGTHVIVGAAIYAMHERKCLLARRPIF